MCEFFLNLGVVFNIFELIKLEYNLKSLKGYIGIPFPPAFAYVSLYLFRLLCIFVFLCRHGAQRREEEGVSCCGAST